MSSPATFPAFAADLPRPGVMCSIVRVSGHHPQEVGARMWVSGDGPIGTLGGGEFERRVIAHALEMLVDDEATAHLEEYVLCRQMGQCCGGRATVFFEPVRAPLRVHVFGGGHIGSALMEVLSGLALEPHVIDQRPHWSTERDWPRDTRVHGCDPLAYACDERFGADDAVCIITHSHDLDFALVEHFLPLDPGYLGLIGSTHKARTFRGRLAGLECGEVLVARWDERMHCPMGRKLPTKNPKAIAIAIATELLDAWALRSPRVRRVATGGDAPNAAGARRPGRSTSRS